MKTKLVKIANNGSEMFFIITEPEEGKDLTAIKKSGLDESWKCICSVEQGGFTWNGSSVDLKKAWESENWGWMMNIIKKGFHSSVTWNETPGTEISAVIALLLVTDEYPDIMNIYDIHMKIQNLIISNNEDKTLYLKDRDRKKKRKKQSEVE